MHVVTQDDGNFEFRQLPPGSWKVTVAGGRIPPAYGYERSSTTVIAQAGRAASVEFRVVIRAQDAVLDDGGSLALPKPDPKPDAKPDSRADRQSRPPR